jgi:signal transduction histidine kinase
MSRARSLNSGAFRFALVIAAMFAVGFLLIFVVVERSIRDYAAEATAVGLRSEMAILTDEPEGGVGELIGTIRQRQRSGYEQPFHYLLRSVTGARLAGDLPSAAGRVGWGQVTFLDDRSTPGERSEPETLRSLGRTLPDGSLLVVATDTFDVQNLRHRLAGLTAWAGIGLTLLALVGGYGVGLVFLRRLGRVNDAVSRVMAGDLAERLPPIGMSPEFNELSSNLNRMLDRISSLLNGLRQVSTDIAHDLRTPLTRLQQRLEAMRGSGSMVAYEAGIDSALGQIDEIHAIFRALLRIGLIEGGDPRRKLQPVDLTELVGRVALAYQPVMEDTERRFHVQVQPGMWALGDPELLAQLLTNLIDNALFHTSEGTPISVSLSQEARHATITVADHGPGVPADERRKILTRFYRLDASRHTPGAGLGLALVAAIADLHHAELLIEDNEPGLRVRLRLADGNSAQGRSARSYP